MKYDCVIIGAGLSGLAAGIRLAHFGKKVRVLEQHAKIGGLNSYYNMKSFEMETGLHAMTNFSPARKRSSTLSKLLRQLRIPYEALMLREQKSSRILFPDREIAFSNDFSLFESSVTENFPDEADNFIKFDKMIREFDELNLNNKYISSRLLLEEFFNNEQLRDMLLCPMMYYGSPSANDVDFSIFAILYKSVFHEGLSRPAGKGIRLILKLLKERFLEAGGELELNCRAKEIISENGRAKGIETAKGRFIETDNILSSAGYLETQAICDSKSRALNDIPEGNISFIETVAVLDSTAGCKYPDDAIIFYNRNSSFKYSVPEKLTDPDSGIICFPQNFCFREDDIKPVPAVRTSVLSRYDGWVSLREGEYKKTKDSTASNILRLTEEITGMKDIEKNALIIDTATPKTYNRFSGHLNGAIYGTPVKTRNGRTHMENLYICGTDQGFIGITGAMFSGITIANLYLLRN